MCMGCFPLWSTEVSPSSRVTDSRDVPFFKMRKYLLGNVTYLTRIADWMRLLNLSLRRESAGSLSSLLGKVNLDRFVSSLISVIFTWSPYKNVYYNSYALPPVSSPHQGFIIVPMWWDDGHVHGWLSFILSLLITRVSFASIFDSHVTCTFLFRKFTGHIFLNIQGWHQRL